MSKIRVFKAYSAGDDYDVLTLDESFPHFRLMTWSEPEYLAVLKGVRASWKGDGRIRPVFPMLSPNMFVARKTAWDVLAPTLQERVVPVEISAEQEMFVAMFVRPFDCLDMSRAVVRHTPSGAALVEVREWAFKSHLPDVPPLFRIPKLGAPVFFSEAFSRECKAFLHSGLVFSEVKYRV